MVNFTPKLKEQSRKQETVLVKEIMNKNYKSLKADDDIQKAMRVLIDNKITGFVVVDQNTKPIGFLSAKDCLKLGLDMKYHNEPPNKIKDYMSTEVTSLSEGADIFDAIEFFTEHHYRIAPVIDELGNVVGVIDRYLTLKALDKMLQTTW